MANGLVNKVAQNATIGGGNPLGAAIGIGMQAFFTYKDYQNYKETSSPAVAALKTAGSFVWYDMLGPWSMATIIPQLAYTGFRESGKIQYKAASDFYSNRGRLGSGYAPMSQAGYTMRQRSINAIRQNGLNLQSVLGNEARQYYGRY